LSINLSAYIVLEIIILLNKGSSF